MQPNNIFQLSYTSSLLNSLKTIATWAKITAICGLASAGVSILGGLKDISLLIASLIGVAISVVINIFLLQFANAVKKGIDSNDNYKISEGFGYLKTYYKVYGIILIVCFSLVLLVLVGSIIFGILSGASK